MTHPHHGHRERLRARFLSDGLDGFNDHQILELLLFNVISRADTNPIAHDLLQRFGSFAAVLEADCEDLQTVTGIGRQAAVFISSLAPLTRRYYADRIKQQRPKLDSPQRAVEYLIPLMIGRSEEVFYVICLDSQNRAIFNALLSEGTVKQTTVYPRKVAEVAIRHKASAVILAHNHPSGTSAPSTADIQLTDNLTTIMKSLDIPVLDHIIIAGAQSYSFADSGKIDSR